MRLLLRRSRRTITVAGAALLAAFGLAVAGGAGGRHGRGGHLVVRRRLQRANRLGQRLHRVT